MQSLAGWVVEEGCSMCYGGNHDVPPHGEVFRHQRTRRMSLFQTALARGPQSRISLFRIRLPWELSEESNDMTWGISGVLRAYSVPYVE